MTSHGKSFEVNDGGFLGLRNSPSDGRYWRVDWFGAIQPNPRVTREPALQVIITPFKTTDIHQLTPNQLASGSASIVDYQQQHTILVVQDQGKLQSQLAGKIVELHG